MPNTVNSYMVTDLGNVSPNPRGEYNATYDYEYLDLIYYKGGSYLCLAPLGETIKNVAPIAGQTTTNWQCVAIPGDITPEYISMYNEVVKDYNETNTNTADVAQMKASTYASMTAAQESESKASTSETNARNSEVNAKQSMDKAKEYSDEAIRANNDTQSLVTGFDEHVATAISNAEASISESTDNAKGEIVAQKSSSLNEFRTDAETVMTNEKNMAITEIHQMVDNFSADADSKKQEVIQVADEKINDMTALKNDAVNAKNAAETAATTAVEKASETATYAGEAKSSSDEAKANADLVAADKAIVAADKTEIGGMKSAVESSVAKFESDLETYNLPTMNNDINALKSDLADLSDKKITKFYASNLGESTLADSDKGKIQDMFVFGKSEQGVTYGINLYHCTNTGSKKVSYGITYIAVENDGISVVGTSTGNSNNSGGIVPYLTNLVDGKTYICKTFNDDVTPNFVLIKVDGSISYESNFVYDSETISSVYPYFSVKKDVTIDTIIYPMVCEQAYSDHTYEPYTGGIPSPNPDYPQPIKSVVNPAFTICGKNICPTYDNIVSTNTKNTIRVPVVGGQTYTLSLIKERVSGVEITNNNVLGFQSIEEYDEGGQLIKSTFGDTVVELTDKVGVTKTFTVSTDTAYIVINPANYNGDNNDNTRVYNVQLEVGDTATPFEDYRAQTASLPYTLNAIPVSEGGNVTIDGQQYVADYVDVERGKLVRMIGVITEVNSNTNDSSGLLFSITGIRNIISHVDNNIPNIFCSKYERKKLEGARASDYSITQYGTRIYIRNKDAVGSLVDSDIVILYLYNNPVEINLTSEEIQAFKALATYYPTTNVFVTSDQLDGYTTFNYPLSMENGWNLIKEQLGDTREYIYDMDLQSAEAYVNSEYAVALAELEV